MNFLILGKIMEIFRTHACGPAWIFLDRQYYWYKGESKKKKKRRKFIHITRTLDNLSNKVIYK